MASVLFTCMFKTQHPRHNFVVVVVEDDVVILIIFLLLSCTNIRFYSKSAIIRKIFNLKTLQSVISFWFSLEYLSYYKKYKCPVDRNDSS